MKNTKNKRFAKATILFLLVSLAFILPLISAGDLFHPFADTKLASKIATQDLSSYVKEDFNSKYGAISISNTFLWMDTGKYADYTLTKNSEICMINCEAEGRVTLYNDGILFDGVMFKNLQGQETSIISSKYYIFKGYKDNYVDVPIYEEKCKAEKDLIKGEPPCRSQVVSYKSENQPIELWDEYNGETLKAGDYRWKIKGVKDPAQSVDFIPLLNDNQFDAWATWTAGLNTNLMAYWKLDESSGTLVDSVNGTNNGTNSGCSYSSAGKINTAMACTSPNYIDVGNKSINIQSPPISINFWLNTSTLAGNHGFFGASVSQGWGIYQLGSTLEFGKTGVNGVDATQLLLVNKYVMITVVYNGTNVLFYINGTARGTPAYSSTFNSLSYRIGYVNTMNLEGQVDEIGVWNRVLTPSEVSDLYNSNNGITYNNIFTFMSITNSIPANNSLFSTRTVNFGCNVTGEQVNITSVVLNVTNKGVQNWTQTISGLETPNYNATFTNTSVPDGFYTWGCLAYGNTVNASSASNFKFEVDTIAPTINIAYPTSSFVATSYHQNISLNYTISHNSTNIGSCWYTTEPFFISIGTPIINCSKNTTFLYPSSTIGNISPDSLKIIFYANDTAGNIGNTNVTITKDITPPNITITYPNGTLNYGYVGQNISINYTIKDNYNVDSCWNDYNGSNVTMNCSLNNSIIFSTKNSVTVYANDSFNNINQSTNTWGFNLFEINRSYTSTTVSGSSETFTINFSAVSFSTVYFYYNNTLYPVSTSSLGSENFSGTTTLDIPAVSSQQSKAFFWSFNDGTINSTTSNQTVNPFQIDNCSVYSHLLFNYTIYDEDTQLLLPNSNNLSTAITANVYSINNNALVATLYFNSTSNNTKICFGNMTGVGYYFDVLAQYDGGDLYIAKFNNIQHQFVNSSTATFNLPLYSLLISRATEFSVAFKDSNFILQPNVLVEVTRNYISEGVFKTVEIAKTDTNGKTLVHLVLGDVIYTIIFKQNGQVLAILSNVLAKCDNIATGTCNLDMNSFSSNIETTDFTYNNNLNVKQAFNKNTMTITADFIVNGSTTSIVTLNVTKYDRFGNTLVCSNSMTSSAGQLSCIVPASFSNATIISRVFNNGVLSSMETYSIKDNPTDAYDGGTVTILAIMMVITLAMLFIHDIRGIMLGTFLGLVLSGALVFINSGNLFSSASAITYILIAGVIILWKINQKDDR